MRWLLVAILALVLALPAQAQIQHEFLPIIDATLNDDPANASVNFGSDPNIFLRGGASCGPPDSRIHLRFNATNTNGSITAAKIRLVGSVSIAGVCFTQNGRIMNTSGVCAISESNITYNTQCALGSIIGTFVHGGSTFGIPAEFSLNAGGISFLNANQNTTVDIVIAGLGINEGAQGIFGSKENNNSALHPKLILTVQPVTPFEETAAAKPYGLITGILVSAGSDNLYWDFQSLSLNTTLIPGADIFFNLTETPRYSTLNGVTTRYATTDRSRENTLDRLNCGALDFTNAIKPSDPPIYFGTLNDGFFSSYCFNLSFQNAGRPLFGAIKVREAVEARGGNLSSLVAFFAVYNESFNRFVVIQQQPDFPSVGDNVTITYQTNIPMTTSAKIRRQHPNSQTFSSFLPIAQVTAGINTNHVIFINSTFTTIPALYELEFSGTSAENISFSSSPLDNYRFRINTISGTLEVPLGINIVPIDQSTQSGVPSSCSVNGGQFVDGVRTTINIGQGRTTSIYVTNFLPLGVGFVEPPTEEQLRGFFGERTVTCIPQSNLFLRTERKVNVTTIDQVIFFPMTGANICRLVTFHTRQDQCEAVVAANALQTGVSWYCSFNPDGCAIISDQTGLCLKIGRWEGFRCDDISAIPPGCAANSTCGIGGNGTTRRDESGRLPQDICDSIGFNLGIGCEASKGMIAIIISIALAGFIAVKTRPDSGAPMAIAFMGLISMFALIGWLPVFIWIILIVITGFLLMNALRRMMTGGADA